MPELNRSEDSMTAGKQLPVAVRVRGSHIENEDEFYYPAYAQGTPNFTEQYKRGFRVAHEFLKTLVPPLTA